MLLKKEPQPAAAPRKADSRPAPTAAFDLDSLRQPKKTVAAPATSPAPASSAERIDASLDGLRQTRSSAKPRKPRCARSRTTSPANSKTPFPGSACIKNSAAPARPTVIVPPAAPRPEPPPPRQRLTVKLEPRPAPPPAEKVMVKEIHETIQDEVIELGEDILRDEPPAEPGP